MTADPYVAVARFAALGRPRELAGVLASIDGPADAIVDHLARHTLILMTLAALRADWLATLPGPLALRLDAWRNRAWVPVDRYLETFETARTALDRAGVPSLLMKGFYFADRLYGGLDRRPQFDIDLLVPAAAFRRARRVLSSGGFRETGYDAHSRTLVRDEVKVDLHRCLRHAPAYRLDERAWWDTAIDAHAGPLHVRTLSDEWALVQVMLAAFEDIGQGLARLRQMADLYLLLRAVDATLDWDAFFAARRRESLLGVTVNVGVLVTALFDAAAEWPRLSAALDTHADLVVADSRQRARDLVAAPRKHPSNFAWFSRIYPGSLPGYLAWFWYGGFPANLADFDLRRLTSTLRFALGARRPGSARAAEGS